MLIRYVMVLATLLGASGVALAQFSSGSTGADVALNVTASGEFDPAGLGLNPSGDNVFNFTTITVAQGVTLRFRSGRNRGKPVIWRATGAVNIAGTLELSGANGIDVDPANPWLSRRPAEPGPGGFWGGLGTTVFLGGTSPDLPPLGPGSAGANFNQYSQGAGHATPGLSSAPQFFGNTFGPVYGNVSLNPLLGGSGGSGQGYTCLNASRGHGGGGGGAIRIISSASILVSGSIRTRGGNGGAPDPIYATSTATCVTDSRVTPQAFHGGGGSGGAIHLIAPTVTGAGALDAAGGTRAGIVSGGLGRVLISSNTNGLTGPITGISHSTRLALPPTVSPPSVSITSINGVNAPASPAGDPAVPDITFAATGQVNVTIAATNVPVGRVVQLTIVPESGNHVTVNCSPLAGSIASSVANCNASFPSGVSLSSVRVTW